MLRRVPRAAPTPREHVAGTERMAHKDGIRGSHLRTQCSRGNGPAGHHPRALDRGATSPSATSVASTSGRGTLRCCGTIVFPAAARHRRDRALVIDTPTSWLFPRERTDGADSFRDSRAFPCGAFSCVGTPSLRISTGRARNPRQPLASIPVPQPRQSSLRRTGTTALVRRGLRKSEGKA